MCTTQLQYTCGGAAFAMPEAECAASLKQPQLEVPMCQCCCCSANYPSKNHPAFRFCYCCSPKGDTPEPFSLLAVKGLGSRSASVSVQLSWLLLLLPLLSSTAVAASTTSLCSGLLLLSCKWPQQSLCVYECAAVLAAAAAAAPLRPSSSWLQMVSAVALRL